MCTTGPVEPVNDINKDVCAVSNCSQRLPRPILWIMTVYATYWTHTTAVCVLTVALTPAFGFHPTPTPSHPPNPLYVPFVILQSR